MPVSDREKISEFINNYFRVGNTKDLESIGDFFLNDPRFSKFGDLPPYDRRDHERGLMLEQLYFASLSDYNFRIDELKIDLFEGFAVCTFILTTTGMVVDDYSFRGTTVNNRSRVTMVLSKDTTGNWKIVHQHFSKMPLDN